MRIKQKVRICVDFAMILLMPCLMAYSLISGKIHEWLGNVPFVLCSSSMFLQVQFVFFDYGESAALFFADYLSVMCLFAVIGYYVSACMNCLNRRRK